MGTVNLSSFFARTPGFGWQYAALSFSALSAIMMILYFGLVRDTPPTDDEAHMCVARDEKQQAGSEGVQRSSTLGEGVSNITPVHSLMSGGARVHGPRLLERIERSLSPARG